MYNITVSGMWRVLVGIQNTSRSTSSKRRWHIDRLALQAEIKCKDTIVMRETDKAGMRNRVHGR